MADDEQGRVRIEQIQGFGRFSQGLANVRSSLSGVNKEHLVPHGPGPLPLADVTGAYDDLRSANELAITRLADFATRADRGLAGLAFVAHYVATNFPATDLENEQQMTTLMFDGQQAAPRVPPNLPAVDPAFQSQPDPEFEPRRGPA